MIRKLNRSLLLLVFTLMLTACRSNRVEYVQTPSGMNVQRGRNYKEVIEDFQDKGFTNIRTEPIRDLEIGWTVKLEEVEEISVGGDTDYDAGAWVPADTEVVIRYHATVLYHETEDDAGADAASETGNPETGNPETGTSETGHYETKFSETETSETGISETGTSETGTSETETSETRPSEAETDR